MKNITRRVKEAGRPLVLPTYGAAKRLGLAARAFELSVYGGEKPLIIYTMGKVGTSSIAHGLARIRPKTPLYHIHTLRTDRLETEERVYQKNFGQLRRIHKHLLDSFFPSETTVESWFKKPALADCHAGS